MGGLRKDLRDRALRAVFAQRDGLTKALRSETAEKLQTTEDLRASEGRLQNAVRIAGIGHFSFNGETGDCVFCSEQHAAHFGMTPEQFCTLNAGKATNLDYVHEDDRAMVAQAIKAIDIGTPQVIDYRAVRPDGEIRYIREIEEPVLDNFGGLLESRGTSIDMTDLKRTEMRLRQSQRFESLGTLTGGVAHDFNNLSAVILGNLELTLEQGPTDDWEDLLNEAVTATKRGAALTKNLLSFSRRAHLEPSKIDLNEISRSALASAARDLPANIDIDTSLMVDLWEVHLDVGSVQDALTNLVKNAGDAMPKGGKIITKTSNVNITQGDLADRGDELHVGRYVMLSVCDTVKGIADDHFDAIFEPFYTDKPVGKGSGLGLSMVHGFVKQSGGAIRVQSELGVGTTFKLYFRAA